MTPTERVRAKTLNRTKKKKYGILAIRKDEAENNGEHVVRKKRFAEGRIRTCEGITHR